MQNKYLTAALIAVVVALLFKVWFSSDADDREAAESYRLQVEQQQDIISQNNKDIKWLTYQNKKLDLKNDSLVDLSSQSKERVKIIYRNNEKIHNTIDTAGVNYIKQYWTTELARLDSIYSIRRTAEDSI
jgi:hypothetical protein